MTKLTLCVTEDDIASTERFKISNPVLHKLQNSTGTLWRLCSEGLAVEIMPPFRVALLPLWALRGWHPASSNHSALPCEIELELHQLQPDGASDGAYGEGKAHTHNSFFCAGAPAQKVKAGAKDAQGDEAIQTALLKVLERNGWSSWRAASPQIFVERTEPFRTIVLTRDTLESAKAWLYAADSSAQSRRADAGSTPVSGAPQRLDATLHSPLAGAPSQPITINLPLHAP